MQAVQAHQGSRQKSFWEGSLSSGVVIFSTIFFYEIFGFVTALIIAGFLGGIVGYFDTPKTKVGFFRYFLTIQLGFLAIALIGGFLSPFLSDFIPAFAAYFLPFFLLINIWNQMPELTEREKPPLWRSLLESFLASLVLAYAFSILKH